MRFRRLSVTLPTENIRHTASDTRTAPLVTMGSVSGYLMTFLPVTTGSHHSATFFSAEALAVWIAVSTPSDRPIVVFTDSASVVSALGSETPSHPWIQAIILHAPPDTTIGWIPGHCGIPGNVEADRLASIGRRARLYCKTIPGDDLKKWLTGVYWSAWSNEWAQSRELFIRKIKGTVVKGRDPPDHRKQVVVSRLRSGHTRASHNRRITSGSAAPFAKFIIRWNTSSAIAPSMKDHGCYTIFLLL